MSSLRVALFVEGSRAPAGSRTPDPLPTIWNTHLAAALGISEFNPVVPISKKHIVALDSTNPPMSGAAEGLDKLLIRKLRETEFDAAMVAWDLVPAWNPQGGFCRWEETVNLYRLLAASAVLCEPWKGSARTRHADLSSRKSPGARSRPPTLKHGAILALCMDPMFESLLTMDAKVVKKVLGVSGRQVPNWPSHGWGIGGTRTPDTTVLTPAVAAIRKLQPRLKVVKSIPGSFQTNKTEWGEFLLRELLKDVAARSNLCGHPICKRLQELWTTSL